MSIGSLAAYVHKVSFGYACERMGNSVRAKLFDTTIRKDITFFDETKTGEISK
jgi:ABC-type multidrug transport system fused ATPase/permease subunit